MNYHLLLAIIFSRFSHSTLFSIIKNTYWYRKSFCYQIIPIIVIFSRKWKILAKNLPNVSWDSLLHFSITIEAASFTKSRTRENILKFHEISTHKFFNYTERINLIQLVCFMFSFCLTIDKNMIQRCINRKSVQVDNIFKKQICND